MEEVKKKGRGRPAGAKNKDPIIKLAESLRPKGQKGRPKGSLNKKTIEKIEAKPTPENPRVIRTPTNDKLKSFQETLNIAEVIVNQTKEIAEIDIESKAVSMLNLDNNIDIDMMKQDFLDSRSNIKSLVEKGNELLERIMTGPESEILMPRQIEALAALHGVIGKNVTLMMESYKNLVSLMKDLKAIENSDKAPEPIAGSVNTGTINNNFIISGNSRDILKMIKEQSQSPMETPIPDLQV